MNKLNFANLLAQYAYNLAEYFVWIEEISKFVIPTILTDKLST